MMAHEESRLPGLSLVFILETLEFSEQVGAGLTKINLAGPGECKWHCGKNRKGQGDSEGLKSG